MQILVKTLSRTEQSFSLGVVFTGLVRQWITDCHNSQDTSMCMRPCYCDAMCGRIFSDVPGYEQCTIYCAFVHACFKE